MTRRVYYWDKVTQSFKEGYPPSPHPKYDDAPMVITDTIDRFYHHGSCTWVDSRSALRDIDRACGTVTSDYKLAPNTAREREIREERKQDVKLGIKRTVEKLKLNPNNPLSRDQYGRRIKTPVS